MSVTAVPDEVLAGGRPAPSRGPVLSILVVTVALATGAWAWFAVLRPQAAVRSVELAGAQGVVVEVTYRSGLPQIVSDARLTVGGTTSTGQLAEGSNAGALQQVPVRLNEPATARFVVIPECVAATSPNGTLTVQHGAADSSADRVPLNGIDRLNMAVDEWCGQPLRIDVVKQAVDPESGAMTVTLAVRNASGAAVTLAVDQDGWSGARLRLSPDEGGVLRLVAPAGCAVPDRNVQLAVVGGDADLAVPAVRTGDGLCYGQGE